MKFSVAIDRFIADRQSEGRINSRTTERSYRSILNMHAEDIANRDPRNVGRDDVKRTLRRWSNPNSQRPARSILVSFYDWAMEEGLRPDNPARQTPRPRKRPTTVYRLTREEATAMLAGARGTRERRAIYLGICAGLRNAELRGLRGRHFQREGFVHVSADIAKGHRRRWVPVIDELEPIVAEIRANAGADEYVLPAQRWRNPPLNTVRADIRFQPSSSQALRSLVMAVAKRAGIRAHVHPHLLRHAFGDHVARFADITIAQALLGHADLRTTQVYTGEKTLDELVSAVSGFAFADPSPRSQTPSARDAQRSPFGNTLEITGEAPTGIEPVELANRATAASGLIPERWESVLSPRVGLYLRAFRERAA